MQANHRVGPNEVGFTLIEVVITAAVLVILASVAVPSYLHSRATANESAALATVRSVSVAQFEFRSAKLVDADQDGLAEFGTLGELAGSTATRTTGETLAPPMLSRSLGTVDATGRVNRAGYLFALYLPDNNGVGLAEAEANRPLISPDLAEQHWTCIAWPARSGTTGQHTYFVSEQGELLKNDTARYSGTSHVPAAGAALIGNATPDHIVGTAIASNADGADGHRWTTVQ